VGSRTRPGTLIIWPVDGPTASAGHPAAFEIPRLPARAGDRAGDGAGGAGDGNRTRMTSLEGVLHVAVRSAELGSSLYPDGRG
jgi:hypothetical protein